MAEPVKQKWSSRKKCKWLCIYGMLISLHILLAGIIMSLCDKNIHDGIIYALVAWGTSLTGTFGIVVAGIHKSESIEKIETNKK